MKTGRYNLGQLLSSTEIEQIIIPELQRDYVWKRRNVLGLLNSILRNFEGKQQHNLNISDKDGNRIDHEISTYLSSEYMRLRYNTRVGFIYAYHDLTAPGQYYLIDGQQRITTLFLLLLALYQKCAPKEFEKKYFINRLPKLDYKVRNITHRFLVDLITFELTKKDSKLTFKDSERYYIDYAADITSQTIYDNYYNVIVPAVDNFEAKELCDYVENYIEFNYFDTNISEQGEKLYLYMNSRGEALSDQEKMKSVVIARSDNKLKAGELWEDWQNFFWKNRAESDKNSDRGFFEFLKWAVILHILSNDKSTLKIGFKSDGSTKSRTENIEDYIRIEKDREKKIQQDLWINEYIINNKSFDICWLNKIKLAVDGLIRICDKSSLPKFIHRNFLHCYTETLDYIPFIGILKYLVEFSNASDHDIVRFGMYLKNLQSDYYLRRNPDNAVLRVIELVNSMTNANIYDTRLLGIYQQKYPDIFKDEIVLRRNDLRFSYFLIDWQEEQSSSHNKFGYWENFFWKITDKTELNRFLRGNHNFIIRLIQKGVLGPTEILNKFTAKIFNRHRDDNLRKELMRYGDISISDNGGSSNLGPWMERWSLLTADRDEKYWDSFFNQEKSIKIIHNYLTKNRSTPNSDPVLNAIADSIGYMQQRFYLWHNVTDERLRVILLKRVQASRTNSRELVIQNLHRHINGSWVWEHNYCVLNFDVIDGKFSVINDRDKGFFIDIWYDWEATGGKWYCQFGHKEKDIPPKFENLIQTLVSNPMIIGTSNNFKTLKLMDPIYTETLIEPYFQGEEWVATWFDNLWKQLSEQKIELI